MSTVESSKNDKTSATARRLRISIVIPVRNEETHIRRTLDMLLEQDYPMDSYELLVVDGHSQDGTANVVRQFQRSGAPVVLLDNPNKWSSAARNIGVRAATGEVVLVIDGHCELPDRGHLQAVSDAFQRTHADVLGRPQPLTVARPTPLQRLIAVARASMLGHHPDSYIYTARDQFVPAASVGAAYRVDVFDKIGWFDERFDACEDVDFNYRADQAGLTCFLASKARVNYYPRETLNGLFCQLARYGRGRVRLGRKHGDTLGWKTLLPAGFVAVLVGLGIVAPLSAAARLAFLVLIAGYAAVIVAVSFWLTIRHRLGFAGWKLPAVFATIHVAAGMGMLQELCLGRRDMRDAADA